MFITDEMLLFYVVMSSKNCATFQEVHAPILGIWGVKLVVIAVFAALSLAIIVSCLNHSTINNFSEIFHLPSL